MIYIDDIAITGKTEAEHMQHLEEVLDRLQKAGVRFKLTKCRFMLKSIKYLGYLIDKEGLHALPEKVEAIIQAQPSECPGATSFPGSCQLLWQVYPQLSNLSVPP